MRCVNKYPLFGKQKSTFKTIRQNSYNSYIDTHVHFDAVLKKLKKNVDYFPQFFKKMNDDNLGSGKCEGIVHVSCSPNPKVIQDSLSLIKNENVYGAFGVHPHYSNQYTPELELQLSQIMKNPKCVAWGEIGLDYHYTYSPVETQKEIFVQQLKMGIKHNKPFVIHTREADKDSLEILKAHVPSDWPIHVHCFTSSIELAARLLEHFKNLYIGFTGIVTFDRNLPFVVRQTPLERILLETDGPYLAPLPFRGQVCHSGHIPKIALKIAEIKNVPVEKVYLTCRKNSLAVYGF